MVFQDEKVGDFINSHFISLKIDGTKGEGSKLKKNLKVKGYPTILFLTPEGEELNRICGFDGNKETYLLVFDYFTSGNWKGKDATKQADLLTELNPTVIHNRLTDYLLKLQNDTENIDLNFIVAMKHTYRWEIEEAQKYFHKVLELDIDNQKGYSDESRYHIATYEARVKKNIYSLHTFLQTTTSYRFIERGYPNLINYYKKLENKNPNQLIKFYEESLEKMPNNSAMLNNYAWYIFKNKIENKYDKGIELAQKAVAISPEKANIWDTLGWLYFEKGDLQNALKSMKKAVELAPDVDTYKNNLKKFEKSLS